MSAQNVLLKELLDNYGYPSTRPVYDMYETTTVQFQLLLAQVIELSERHQTIEISAWLSQSWTDEFMQWDPTEHNDVDYLYVHRSQIWLPDTTLYKGVHRDFESYKDIPVLVYSDGFVYWSTPAILKSSCRIDARLFPFDTQVCTLKFTSWVYSATEMNFTKMKNHANQTFYSDIGVWELLKVTITAKDSTIGGLSFPELSYSIHLRRRPLFYLLEIVLPCVLLSLLNLMVFVLPPESGEKISLGMTNLLSLVLFQQLISNSVPPTSDNTPIIGYYFTPMIALSCFSIVCTVTVLNLYYRDNRRPIPRWMKWLVLKVISKLVRYQAWEKTPEQPQNTGKRDGSFSNPDTVSLGETNPGNLTGTDTELTPSRVSYCRVAGWGENRLVQSETINTSQGSLYASVTRSKIVNAPVARAKAKLQPSAEVESMQDRRHQSGDLPSSQNVLLWRDVALVIDRAALMLCALVTVIAMVITIVCFIIRVNGYNLETL
ncbi:neuronal acetylcholine receptor subunit beta-3-like [Asterias rubens]|uniref:neuronal acetylcholine receptor subunit beta-3-like n=1 Tax=Asterias rubens TaxID=7604 RepID=UPI0014551016|nr:neuronal acetylcholine receptor subunit beta-3-like [Asterias rubens]